MAPAGSVIRTVRGDVPAADWGLTNAHAHLIHDISAHHEDPAYPDFALTEHESRAELRSFAAAGGYALVECTPMGLGRDPAGVRRLSEDSGVHVILGAGIYHERFHPAVIDGMSDAQIAELMVREITEGIDGSDIRAGVIGEVGSHRGALTAAEEAVFRAAARAAKSTGAAISTHTHAGELATDQLDVLLGAGVDPAKVIVGHLDDRGPIDLELCREVARRGAWIQFDDVGYEYYTATLGVQMPTDAERLEAIATLAEEGFASAVILGSDMCRRRHLSANGGAGLAHLAGEFVRLARERGFTPELLDGLFAGHIRDALAFG